ncbi:MAG TPA: four helix bundle protein [bacterium]|nr:four helix bundle protein [bacterium]
MGKIETFRDVLVWQKAHQFVLQVYQATKNFPHEELYGLTSQLRRSVVSVASNIVEGFKRKGVKDSRQFYNIAQASLEEARYQLLLARDLLYIADDMYAQLEKWASEVSRMLAGWMHSRSE